jgi:hypothetical protein
MLAPLVSGSDIGARVSLSDSIDGRLGSGVGDSLVGSGEILIALGSGHGGCPPPLPPAPPSPPDTIGASLDSSPGKLSALNVGDPLVGAGDVLNSLEPGGGVIDVSEATPLGGMIDGSWLVIGPMDSVDVCSEGIDAGLEGGGALGCDDGDGLVPTEGNGLAADGDSADGSDPGDAEGGSTLDGPTAEDTVVGESELGWPDVGEPALLSPVDVVPELTPDGTSLLVSSETCELASGLADPLGLADDKRLDTGLTLAGGGGLPETGEGVDGVLLGMPDDKPDGLPMLDITGLAADDARDGGRLSDDVPAELPTLTGED